MYKRQFLGVTRDWHWWPLFMVPFAILGLFVAVKIWHHLPEATKKYIRDVEQKRLDAAAAAN